VSRFGAGGLPGRLRDPWKAGSQADARITRSLGAPALFAVGLLAVSSSILFALGIVAGRALGLTPVAFAAAAVFFVLTTLTYVEATSLHPERGGASVFARYAFNELWSFVAGWAILLDYLIVMAIGSLAVSHYLAAFWGPLGDGGWELLFAGATIGFVAWANVRGVSAQRYRVILVLSLASLALLALILVVGLAQLFDLSLLTDSVELGTTPEVGDLIFAAVVATVACTGIEAASGLADDMRVPRSGLRRLTVLTAVAMLTLFVAFAALALMAVPVLDEQTALGGALVEAPVLGIVAALEPAWLADTLRYAVGAVGALVLVQAANGQMLGIGRLAYSLGVNRQVPSAVSRLDDRYGTPYVTIIAAAAIALGLALSADLEFLGGVFAFGAMIAFTLAHLSVIVLRFREPARPRLFRVPLNVRLRGADVPLPAVLGAVMGVAGWLSVVVLFERARIAGTIWMVLGLLMYVVYRRTQGKSLTRRFTISEAALRETADTTYGSILVPVFGEALDDDIVGTAGRLASEEADAGEGGAVLEALYVFEIPMSLPIDARVSGERMDVARRALSRAKEVGEEYEGVEVATAMSRGRSVGSAIVNEARRRGVEAIVLAAEAPSRIRGGAMFGGSGLARERFAGDTTRYVIEKAPCKVILTAPPADADARVEGDVPATTG